MNDSDKEICMNTGNWIFRIRILVTTVLILFTILSAGPVWAQNQEARDAGERRSLEPERRQIPI